MVFPRPEETAVLTVNGQEFTDWETVMVRLEMYVFPWAHFRFTCSEGMPLAANWAALQILPGMECTVKLAGFPAITGLVVSRQVFYDKLRHHIEIQGANQTIILGSSSVVSKTGEHNNVTYKQYATDLLKNWPAISFMEEGGSVPNDKFERISNPPGTAVLDALEWPLRSLGGIPLSTDTVGNVVALVGPKGGPDTVTEGVDILEGREIIYNAGMAAGTYSIGHRPGTDQIWGAKAASEPYFGNNFQSMVNSYAPSVTPLEVPAWQNSFVEKRTNSERDWQGEDEITVFAVVYGWTRPSGGLWWRNQTVNVVSPMLVMDGHIDLRAKSVTFTQDNQTGTRTTLELCNARALHGEIPQGPGGG